MGDSGGYQIDPGAARTVLGDLAGLLGRLNAAVADVRGLAAPTGSYGLMGAAVSSANAQLQTQQAATLAALAGMVAELHRRIEDSVAGYDRADHQVAGGLHGMSTSNRAI